MGIKRLLVVYSGEAGKSGGLQVAIDLARMSGAHLSGVVARGPGEIENRIGSRPSVTRFLSSGLLDVLQEVGTRTIGEIRSAFETRMETEGLAGRSAFIDLDLRRGGTLAELARSYDLVIMGRRASDIGREFVQENPDEIALSSGRSLILAPSRPVVLPDRLHGLVAWDGKRAAARALGDALHVLGLCERMSVLSVGEKAASAADDGIMQLLDHHGVRAERLHRHAAQGGISGTILGTCRDVGANLLIMGAYERSKLLEDFWGGVTRDILNDADIPVLMAH